MRIEETEWSGIWEVLGCKWTFHIIRLLEKESEQSVFIESPTSMVDIAYLLYPPIIFINLLHE